MKKSKITKAWDHYGNRQNHITDVTGYMLEPKTDPLNAQVVNSDTSISPGTYNVVQRSDGKWEVQNVPERSDILIYTGNDHTETAGCFLPGETSVSSGSNYEVGGNRDAFDALTTYLDTYGSNGVTIIVE